MSKEILHLHLSVLIDDCYAPACTCMGPTALLTQLLETFRWLPSDEQTAALLTAQEFLDKLEQIYRCPARGRGGGAAVAEDDEGRGDAGRESKDDVNCSLDDSEKSAETKSFASLIPLDEYDERDARHLTPSGQSNRRDNVRVGSFSSATNRIDEHSEEPRFHAVEQATVRRQSAATSPSSVSNKPGVIYEEMHPDICSSIEESLDLESRLEARQVRRVITESFHSENPIAEIPRTQLVAYQEVSGSGSGSNIGEHYSEEEALGSDTGSLAVDPGLMMLGDVSLQAPCYAEPSQNRHLDWNGPGRGMTGGADCEEQPPSDTLDFPPVMTDTQKSRSRVAPPRRRTSTVSSGRGLKRKRPVDGGDLDSIDGGNLHPADGSRNGADRVDVMEPLNSNSGEKKAKVRKNGCKRQVRAIPRESLPPSSPPLSEQCHHTPTSRSIHSPITQNSGPVSCRLCRSEFTSFRTFDQHLCKDEKKFMTCKKCDLWFCHPRQFRKHVFSHKRNDCRTCGASFTERKALKAHAKQVHGVAQPKRYHYCPHCDKKFLQRASLYAHLKEHAGDMIVCIKCGTMCEDESEYEQHIAKHAEEATSYCDKCDESFVRRQQYDQHVAGHQKYDCVPCQKNFSTKKQMLKHQRIVHGVRTQEERRHECQVCHKKFQRPTLLEVHTRVHTGEKPIQCAHCGKSFRTSKSLTKHLKTSTHMKACGDFQENELEATKTFLCAQCGAKFFRKQGLLRHMQQLHSDERPYECEFCEYKCKCKTNLKRHIELHKDERRFICELCGASFHAHATLKEHHAYVHSDVRGFVCPSCGKGFKGRSGLRRHTRIHSDARPFICFCGQSYKRMSHLKRHMASIHAISFKSKRVKRIAAATGSGNNSGGGDDSDSMLVTLDPPLHVTEDAEIIFGDHHLTRGASLEVPLMNGANELLILESGSNPSSDLVAQAVTLEVATQTIGPDGVMAQMHIPCPAAQQPLPIVGPEFPIELSAAPVLAAAEDHSLNRINPLPSISDTVELRRALAFASIALPLSAGNIAVSIPAEVAAQASSLSLSSPVPSKQEPAACHELSTLAPPSIPLQSMEDSEPRALVSESTLIPLSTTEFYDQGLAQYLTM